MSLNYIAIILGSLGIVIVLSLVSGASAMLCINDKLPITDEDDKNSDGDDDFDDDDFDDDDMEEDDE